MKSLLEQVDQLDKLIRELRKTESMLWSGKFLDANRIVCALTAWAEANKRSVLEEAQSEKKA